ncbi:MAG TPA: hypothetical protein PLV92_29255, partial [Pirellulaceae bacterium]|nr:hypothetical protein [Pirellulaceae bacterium]
MILEINGEETPSGLIVDDLLKKSRPGEKLKIQLQRDGQQLDYSVTLRAHPLEIVRPDRQTEHESVEGHPLSCLVGLETVGIGTKATNVKRDADEIGALPSLREGHWELVSSNADMAEFRFVVGAKQLKAIGQTGELEVIKRYQLAKTTTEQIEQVTAPAYHVNIELEIRSRGVPNRAVAYRMSGPNGLPLEGWWYMSKTGARDVVIRTDAGGMQWKRCPEIYKKAIKRPTEAEPNVEPWVTMFAGDTPVSGRAIRYIGVDAQYFSAVLFPIGSDGGGGVFRQARAVGIGDARRIPSARNKTLNVSFELSSEPTMITEEAPLKHTFKLFAGPKQADLLDQYGATGAGGK